MGTCYSQEEDIPKFSQKHFEITVTEVRAKIALEKDRKIMQLASGEGEQKHLLSATNQSRDAVLSKANTCLNTLRWVEASKILIRDLKVLLDSTIHLAGIQKEKKSLGEFEPLIHTVIWGRTRLNLVEINTFIRQIEMYFDKDVVKKVETDNKVDLKLKRYFKSLMNTPIEIHEYLQEFIARNDLDREVLTNISGDYTMLNNGNPGTGYLPGNARGP